MLSTKPILYVPAERPPPSPSAVPAGSASSSSPPPHAASPSTSAVASTDRIASHLHFGICDISPPFLSRGGPVALISQATLRDSSVATKTGRVRSPRAARAPRRAARG